MKRRVMENIDGVEQVKMVDVEDKSLKEAFDDIGGLMKNFFETTGTIKKAENDMDSIENRLKFVQESIEDFRKLDIWNRLTENEQRIINDIEIAIDLSDNESDNWRLNEK